MANPSMTRTKLEVLRSMKEPARLIKNLEPDSTQELMFVNNGFPQGMPAGRCVHMNSTGKTELGVAGRNIPFWLFRDTGKPSGGWSGDSATVATDATFADGSEHKLLHFAGIEGLEIATTEFIAGSYAIDDMLTAPTAGVIGGTDADKVASAGKVTKSSVLYGKSAVVGVVSEAVYYKAHNMNLLQFYTLYRPPIEALPNGLTQPTWA